MRISRVFKTIQLVGRISGRLVYRSFLLSFGCFLVTLTSTAQGGKSVLASQSGSFFAVSVSNMEESVRWYEEKLALHQVMHVPKNGHLEVVVMEGEGLIVELVSNDQAVSFETVAPVSADITSVHGFFKAGIIVDDFDELVAALKKRNVPIFLGPFPSNNGQRTNLIIKDNSGNLIQFFGKK